jgi:hypothetical protein
MKITKAEKQALKQSFDTNNYESLNIGDYIDTKNGSYYLKSKPNIHQPVDDRQWVFIKTEDETGEPYMDDVIVTIK